MNLTTTRTRLVLGAATLLALLVVPFAVAANDHNPTATASSSVKKQVKKLKKQVAELQQQVATVQTEPGPQGARGATGAQGPQGEEGPPGPSTGPANGDLTGNYPDPLIAPGAVTTSKIGPGAVTTSKIGPGAVTPDEIGTTPAARVRSPNRDGVCVSTIPDATPTTLTFEDVEFDTAGMYDPGSFCFDSIRARLTAPRNGVYQISAGVLWPQDTVGTRYLGINKNGSQALAADEREANGGSGAGSTLQTVTTMTDLCPGDFVTAQVNQTSGGDLDIPASDSRNYFSAVWLGPDATC